MIVVPDPLVKIFDEVVEKGHQDLVRDCKRNFTGSSFISSQTSSTSRNNGRISSFMELTNVEIVLSAAQRHEHTFSWHACSISSMMSAHVKYPSRITFSSIRGSYARRPVSSFLYFSSNRLMSIRSSTSV